MGSVRTASLTDTSLQTFSAGSVGCNKGKKKREAAVLVDLARTSEPQNVRRRRHGRTRPYRTARRKSKASDMLRRTLDSGFSTNRTLVHRLEAGARCIRRPAGWSGESRHEQLPQTCRHTEHAQLPGYPGSAPDRIALPSFSLRKSRGVLPLRHVMPGKNEGSSGGPVRKYLFVFVARNCLLERRDISLLFPFISGREKGPANSTRPVDKKSSVQPQEGFVILRLSLRAACTVVSCPEPKALRFFLHLVQSVFARRHTWPVSETSKELKYCKLLGDLSVCLPVRSSHEKHQRG